MPNVPRQDESEALSPGELWSLLDMLEHNAKRWQQASNLLVRKTASLLLLPVNELIPEDQLAAVIETLDVVVAQCEEIGLAVSTNMATETNFVFKRQLEEKDIRVDTGLVKNELESIVSAITSELNSHIFLKIRPDFAKYYSDLQPFGEDIADKFPSAIRDIEYGGKALACGLGTASVFHMMRIMELGLRSIAKPLGIPYAPSWESHLKQIEAKITAKHRSKGIKWKRDEPFFRDIMGDLMQVKIAWRNPTMHIVRHYSQDEADDVFRAVKRFMNRLAERFSE